jgi:hypothetical protein
MSHKRIYGSDELNTKKEIGKEGKFDFLNAAGHAWTCISSYKSHQADFTGSAYFSQPKENRGKDLL